MQSSSDNQSSSLELSSLSVPTVLEVPGTMIEGEQESGGSSGRSRHSSRSPPLLRRQAHALAPRPLSFRNRIPNPATSQMSDAAEQEPQTPELYSFSASQNVLNVGASPQEVLQAQREAANQAAQNVAERAEIFHNVAMHQVEQQAQGSVEDAMSNLDFLRAQVAEANARGDQLRIALEATQADLTASQAELTRIQAELHQVQFQLSQHKILCQVKER